MIRRIKNPISILLSLIMVFSVFAAVPMTLNAAPPGGLTGHTLTLYANNGTNESYSDTKMVGTMMIGTPTYYGFTTPDNKEFSCWNTQANGGGTDYTAFSNYSYKADLTLYAQWVSTAPAGETITLDLNADNADIYWDDSTAEDEYWRIDADYDDGNKSLTLTAYDVAQAAGTFTIGEEMSTSSCCIIDPEASEDIYFTAGSCTVTVDGDTVTVEGSFTGSDGNTYILTITYALPVPQTIELTLNPDNASVTWYDATDSDGYWSMEAAYNDGCYLVLKGNSNQPAGTYGWADMGSGCEIIDYEANKRIDFVDGSCTVTVDEDVVTVSGTFTGRDRNTYVVTVTHEAPYYTITDESVNGAVTAGVNGADVTRAKAGKTVLLNVAPAEGYQLKSITASAQKTTPEDFSELVALMGDAVFDGDDNYDCGGYTCKVEDGKFVVYNGTTLVAELSESNKTGFNGDSDYVEVNSEDALWAFFVENGEITGIDVSDTNDYYIFCSLSGSKSTGTLQPVQVDLTTVAEGSQYSFTMPAKNVTVKAEFEAIPTYTVTWKNGDTTLETDTDVAEGTTPTYDGEVPTKAEDEQNTYTFAGWTDGENSYGLTDTLPAVSGNVTYTATFTATPKAVDPVYLVTIPETVDLGANGTATMTITICGETSEDDVVLPSGKKVNVALTDSANGFNLRSADNETIAYTVNGKSAVADLTTVAECSAGKASETITFAKTGETKYSGSYTDTLTFTVSLEDA